MQDLGTKCSPQAEEIPAEFVNSAWPRLIQKSLPTRRVLKCLRAEDSILWAPWHGESERERERSREGADTPPLAPAKERGNPQAGRRPDHRQELAFPPNEETYAKCRAEIRARQPPPMDLKPETYEAGRRRSLVLCFDFRATNPHLQ